MPINLGPVLLNIKQDDDKTFLFSTIQNYDAIQSCLKEAGLEM